MQRSSAAISGKTPSREPPPQDLPGRDLQQRRCLRREFRLRPDRLVVQIVLYSLAYTANKYGIRLHELIGLGNPTHLLATDPRANRPASSRAVNAAFGEWDALWSA